MSGSFSGTSLLFIHFVSRVVVVLLFDVWVLGMARLRWETVWVMETELDSMGFSITGVWVIGIGNGRYILDSSFPGKKREKGKQGAPEFATTTKAKDKSVPTLLSLLHLLVSYSPHSPTPPKTNTTHQETTAVESLQLHHDTTAPAPAQVRQTLWPRPFKAWEANQSRG